MPKNNIRRRSVSVFFGVVTSKKPYLFALSVGGENEKALNINTKKK